VVIDIGTGGGQAVLRRARREPRTLAIGIDAEATALADASRRAAASVTKGGLPNALFLAESAERLPGILAGRADLVTVVLPWGSLLRGILAPDTTIVAGLRELLKPTGELVLLLSEIAREQVDTLVDRLEGLAPLEVREAAESDVAELSSGWARRLGIPGSRPAWVIRLRRDQVANRRRAPWCRRRAGAPAPHARERGC
jgi:16S rRNA (adenine(1408)-N(1))-methyltransferase